MYIRKLENQPWSEIEDALKNFYSNTDPWVDIDEWDLRVKEAIKQILESVAKFPEEDRKRQTGVLWQNWLESNPQPKIVDQMSRHELSQGLKPPTAKDLEEITEFFTKLRAKNATKTKDELLKELEMSILQNEKEDLWGTRKKEVSNG